MSSALCRHRLIVAGLLLTLAANVQAQALFLARKAIGRVEQMTQSAPTGKAAASYDVASVIVEVAADRVFDAVKRQLAQNRRLTVTRTDEARRTVEFTDGTQIGGIQVNVLGDQISHLLVSTAGSGNASNASTIAEHVFEVCRRLDVVCERPDS